MTSNKYNGPFAKKLACQLFLLATILVVVLAGVFIMTKAMLQKSETSVSGELNETAFLDEMEINDKQIETTIGQDDSLLKIAEENNERDSFIKSLDLPKSASNPNEDAESIIFR